MAVLEVKNMGKSYGTLEVLQKIDFSLEKGESLAIIGSSGSGKTTLLRCLNFLEKPDKGSIMVNNEVILMPWIRHPKGKRSAKNACISAWSSKTLTYFSIHGTKMLHWQQNCWPKNALTISRRKGHPK